MATLTNIAKTTGSLTAIPKPLTGGQVFYGWLFWFTISGYAVAMTNVTQNPAALTNIPKQ